MLSTTSSAKSWITRLALILAVAAGKDVRLGAAQPSAILDLWPPGKIPGISRANADEPERLVTDRRRTFDQFTNIAIPQVAVFLAPEEKRTGAAVLVCPGGGMQRLAYEHEGLEIADWLNPLGISVFVLKYRVPGPSSTALLDAQRAMGLIRHRADEFQIDPERIAAMGFSAGGEVALLLATHFEARNYEAVDDADELPCRPASACLIYPGGIVRQGGELRQEIADKLQRGSTPDLFLVHAFSDASMNSLALGIELKRRGIPCEMHIYQEGGHGFGARDSALPLSGWKASYLEWIRAQGFFDPPYVAKYADELILKLSGNEPLTPLSRLRPGATLTDGYAVQRKLVRAQASSDPIAGYKAGYVTRQSQQSMGLSGPLTGVLFRSGRTDLQGPLELGLADLGPSAIETELGFVVSRGLDISTRIATEKQIKGAFEAVVPVIELPIRLQARITGELQAVDIAAANIGSKRILVAAGGASPDDFRPEELKLLLTRDGNELHAVRGDTIDRGLWRHLITVVNQLVDQGYTLREGQIIIAGALGQVHPAEAGKYSADYGSLGKLEFTIK